MDLRALFLAATPTGTRLRYVATTGSDSSGTGASGAPYASINKALSVAQAGDCILVSGGTYGTTLASGVAGRREAWITVLPATSSDAVIVSITTTTDNFFNIAGSSFLGFYGLEVFGNQTNSNTNGSGISIYGGSHHIRVWGCHIHDFPGGGINCYDSSGSHDMLDLSFNRIHATSRYSPQNTSGISIYASQDYTHDETWPDGHAYRIVGNYIYDVVCTVPFTPGGFAYVTDGNGVSLDLIFDTHGYTKPILVEGNIITGCGARAMHAYGTINVDCVGNLGWGNIRNVTSSTAITGAPEFDSQAGSVTQTTAQGQSTVIHGNIIFPTNTTNWRDSRSTYTANVVLAGTQAVDGTSIDHTAVGTGYAPGLTGDPTGYIDPTTLAPTTPDLVARHAGVLGYQALGLGARPVLPAGSATWAAGAVEQPLTPRYLMPAVAGVGYGLAPYGTSGYGS